MLNVYAVGPVGVVAKSKIDAINVCKEAHLLLYKALPHKLGRHVVVAVQEIDGPLHRKKCFTWTRLGRGVIWGDDDRTKEYIIFYNRMMKSRMSCVNRKSKNGQNQ